MPHAFQLFHLLMHTATKHGGPLTKDDLVRVNLPNPAAANHLDGFMNLADTDGDGLLSREDFIKYALAFRKDFEKKFDYQSKDGTFSVADAIDMYLKGAAPNKAAVLNQEIPPDITDNKGVVRPGIDVQVTVPNVPNLKSSERKR